MAQGRDSFDGPENAALRLESALPLAAEPIAQADRLSV